MINSQSLMTGSSPVFKALQLLSSNNQTHISKPQKQSFLSTQLSKPLPFSISPKRTQLKNKNGRHVSPS